MKAPLFTLFLFVLPFALSAQAEFQDISVQAGINNTGSNFGVAFADFDLDGLEDIYVSRHNVGNILYKNQGDGTYIDVAADAGVAHQGTTTASIWGDIDNDGHLDLYLGNRDEPNVLYLNNGDGTFTDISESAGVDELRFTKAVMFGDVDRDGFIDLYVANLSEPNALYHNNGDLTFSNITNQSGATDNLIAMGSMFFDYDNDGDLDLYLTHDADQPYILYQNDGTGSFTDVSEASGTDYAGMGMGVDFGDVNNDGWLDIYITNLSYNTLLLNNADGTFTDISFAAGVTDPGMGWGTVWFDYDNDGFQDIYVANDSYFSPAPNVLYRNNGNNTFSKAGIYTVLQSMYGGYGVATTDVNNDGYPDLFLANRGSDGNQLFLNQTDNDYHWTKVSLIGTISNRAAIGARVEIEAGGKIYVDEVAAGIGYAGMNSLTLHFGLGTATSIDRLSVRWPNGLVEEYQSLSVDGEFTLTEGAGIISSVNTPTAANAMRWLPGTTNPFSYSTTIAFELAEKAYTTVDIMDLNGQVVSQLTQGELPAGPYQFDWSPQNLAGGLYICRLQSGGKFLSKKVVYQPSR